MKKVVNFMLSRKVKIIYLIAALIKKSQNFPKPYERCGRNVKVELNLSNYATKVNLKGAVGGDTSNLEAKPDLASLKSEVDMKTVHDKLVI